MICCKPLNQVAPYDPTRQPSVMRPHFAHCQKNKEDSCWTSVPITDHRRSSKGSLAEGFRRRCHRQHQSLGSRESSRPLCSGREVAVSPGGFFSLDWGGTIYPEFSHRRMELRSTDLSGSAGCPSRPGVGRSTQAGRSRPSAEPYRPATGEEVSTARRWVTWSGRRLGPRPSAAGSCSSAAVTPFRRQTGLPTFQIRCWQQIRYHRRNF